MSIQGKVVAGIGIGAAAFGVAEAYRRGGEYYLADLESRMPPGGQDQSMLPFLVEAARAGQEQGLDMVLMGGPVKQALCDPETEIDPILREIRVSSNPNCRTRKKDSLYRPEMTLRDADNFVYSVNVGGHMRPANPRYDEQVTEKGARVQEAVNALAVTLGFPEGPEISVFNYEEPQGPFRITHYATVTQALDKGAEHMSHSLGAKQEFTEQERWTFVMDGMRVPTTSPVRILGRTHTRSLVYRERDRGEVQEAVQNIVIKGQFDDLLGPEWLRYEALRHELDKSLRVKQIFEAVREAKLAEAGNIAAALVLAPLAPKIEASWVARMIRDPKSKLYEFTSGVMGAKRAKQAA